MLNTVLLNGFLSMSLVKFGHTDGFSNQWHLLNMYISECLNHLIAKFYFDHFCRSPKANSEKLEVI